MIGHTNTQILLYILPWYSALPRYLNNFSNKVKNIPMVLPSSPIKIWGKPVKGCKNKYKQTNTDYCFTYSCWHLYQYIEDDFSMQVLIFNKLFQTICSHVNKKMLVIDCFLMCCVSMLFESLIEIKNEDQKSSSLFWY